MIYRPLFPKWMKLQFHPSVQRDVNEALDFYAERSVWADGWVVVSTPQRVPGRGDAAGKIAPCKLPLDGGEPIWMDSPVPPNPLPTSRKTSQCR